MAKTGDYKVGDEPIPGYRLTSFLGAGNFGAVWKATGPGATEVAMKFINLMMQGALKEFRSLTLVKRIQHPNLVPILAIWLKDPDGELFTEAAFEQADLSGTNVLLDTLTLGSEIQLQWSRPAELILAMGLGHKSLYDRLQECREQGLPGIPREELLNLMQDAARAIDYLNSPRSDLGATWKAIQHCDIKPSNLLIVGDAVQVCDFSLARIVNDPRKTSAAFTPLFAAPEIIETNIPSRSTDQYSLAVAYIELRTGELPFPAEATAHKVMQAHLDGKLDLTRLEAGERAVILRATARDPEARYASTSTMVAALRAAAVVPEPRRRWVPWSIGAVVLLLVGAAAGGPFLYDWSRTGALPADCVSAEDTGQYKSPGGRSYPTHILCERHGLKISFRLVDDRSGKSVPAFYIMETKVSNRMFSRFAEEKPDLVRDSFWRLGAKAGGQDLGVDEKQLDLPVFNVTYAEAKEFAKWLGGSLPTKEQWDTAAGRYADAEEKPRTVGPFVTPETPGQTPRIAVDRGESGPADVGSSPDDISAPYLCRDMAGNGLEWTQTPQSNIQVHPDLTKYILRGRSYLNPDPLTFAELEELTHSEAKFATEQNSEISFRVVLDHPFP